MKRRFFRGLTALLLAVALLAATGVAEEIAVEQASGVAEGGALVERDGPEGAEEVGGEALATPDAPEAEVFDNGATKLSVSKKKTVTLYVGKSYQLTVPGKEIKTCKSADSKIVKATKAGLLTVKKKGTTKVTVTPKGGKAFVLTVKAEKQAKELSGYVGKNAKQSAKKLGLTKKKNGSGGALKYIRYYKGGVSLYNYKGPWDKGQVDAVRIEDTSDYSLIGITVGMKLADVRKKLKKYEDVNYFGDFGGQLYYVITWEGDEDFPITDLSVGYNKGKVIWLHYSYYID